MGRGSDSDPYRRLFQATVDGVVVVDAATARIVLANKAASRIFGFTSPDALVGLNPLDRVPQEDRERVAQLMAESFTENKEAPAEFRITTADKREAWISVHGILVEHNGKKATLATIRDITVGKSKEAALKEAEHRYERLFHGMLDGAVVLDLSTFKIRLASTAAATMFGFASPQEAVGVNPLDFIPEEDRNRVIQLIASNLEGKNKNPSETKMITRDKREIWISATATGVDYEGRPAVIATIRDITADKVREAALKEAEHRYERLFDGMLDGAVVLDISTFKITLASKAAAAMFGFASPEEMVGEDPLDFIPEEDRNQVAQLIALNLDGKNKNPAEIRVITRDKRHIWVSATATEVDYAGRTAVIATMRDITSEKEKDAALRASEENRMRLVEAASDAIFVIQDGKMVYVNPAGARGAGLTQQELAGMSFLDLVHPDSRQAVIERYEKLCAGQFFPGLITVKGVDAQGQTRWSNIQEIPFTWQGRPAVMSLIADITDKVLAEQALKEKEERLRTIMENTWDGLAILDENFRITFESPSLSKITGYSPEEWTGTTPELFKVHPDDQGPMLTQLQTLKSQPGSTIRDFVIRYQHRDGTWRTMEATGRNLLHDPKVKGIVANFRDITERKEAEEALKESETLLRDTQELARVGGWEYDVERKQTLWTDETYRIHEIPNLPSIDHINESLKCYPPMDRQVVKQAFQRCIEEGVPYDLVLPFMTFKGNRRWVRTTAKAIRERNKTVRVVGNIVDITERKGAEEALLASEERYRKVVDNASEAIAVLQDGVIKFANPRTAAISGYTVAELTLKPFLELVHPDDTQMVADYYVLKQKGKEAPSTYQFRFRDKAGNTGCAEANVTLIIWEGRLATLLLMNIITERKMIEEALKDREAKYRGLFEGTQIGIEVVSVETGLVVLANRAAARMFGFASPADLIGIDPIQFLRPEDKTWVTERIAGVMVDNRWDDVVELQVRANDGRWVWISGMAAKTEHQDQPALLISLVDITRRKQAEETLRASEEKYRFLVDSTSDFIWTTDLDLHTTYASPSVERILGFTPEERLNQDVTKQTTPESLARAKKALLEHLALEQDPKADSHRTLTIEMEYYHKDGSTVWLESQIGSIRDAEGRLVAFHGVSRDISDRRKAEQVLRESEEHFRTLIEESTDAIVIVGATGEVLYESPSIERVTGYRPEDWQGSPFEDWFLHPDDRAALATVLESVLGEPNATLEGVHTRFKHKDGTWHTLEFTVRNLLHDPKVNGLVINCRDITERVRSQESLTASEANYKRLFEHTLLGTEVVDAETGKVVLANNAVARIFGLKSAADAIGISPMDYILPEDRDWVAQRMADAFVNPEKTDISTIRSGTYDGRIVWLTATAASFEYQGKRAILVSLMDVTAIRDAEAKLHESEEKNRLLIDNASEAIAVIQDGATKFFNRRLAELTGCTDEELFTISFLELVHPEERETIALNYMNRVAGNSVPNNYQFRIIDRRGDTRWLQVNAVCLNWEGKLATLTMFSDVTERVKAEQAVRDSEERFRALIEKATDAVVVLDETGKILYYSPSLERTTGYGLDEWLNMSLTDFKIHPDDLASLWPVYEGLLKEPGKAAEGVKVRYIHKDGTWHTLEATGRNMLHDPKIRGIVANFRDVTERVKAEQAVKESEERYRLLAENVSDVIWVTDMNLKPTYISPSSARMMGITSEQAMTGGVETRLTPASAKVALKAFSKALARESEQPGVEWDAPPLDLEIVRADGSTLWTAANFSYIRGADGKPVAMLGVLRDISERKKAEDSLRRSEERFRGLVETSSDWVWEIDVNSRYTYVSPKVRDILGYEPQELLGRTPFDFMHQREGRRVSKIMRRFATEHLPFSLLESTSTHKDGRSVVLETSAVPIMDSSGSLFGYRGINRDITERKKVEQELQRSLKRLEKTMESTIEAITTTIETRDPYTTGHQMRVTDLACTIAKMMEIPPSKIEGIRVAGLLHDIGKIAVPTEILSKPGKLNDVEYEMIKTHAKIGYNILKKIEFPWPVARTVLQHHERWNGSGYPYGIRGEDILLEARILAVADVMEAMSSHRPYRPSIGADKALDEITRNSGILYDPAVANACIAAFAEFGFKFASSLPGVVGESEVAPAERHMRYSLEDH